MTNFLITFLAKQIANNNQVPSWVTAIIVLLSAIGVFWNKIKSTIDKIILNNKNYRLHKLKMKKSEALIIKELEDKLKYYERESIRLNASLTALIPILTKILSKYPEFQFLIESLDNIINKNNKNG